MHSYACLTFRIFHVTVFTLQTVIKKSNRHFKLTQMKLPQMKLAQIKLPSSEFGNKEKGDLSSAPTEHNKS